MSHQQNLTCGTKTVTLKSFIYTKNKRGPRTEPCGTPDFITSQEDL